MEKLIKAKLFLKYLSAQKQSLSGKDHPQKSKYLEC
jgi:hypothetical protein